jgi:hypothetical protein
LAPAALTRRQALYFSIAPIDDYVKRSANGVIADEYVDPEARHRGEQHRP